MKTEISPAVVVVVLVLVAAILIALYFLVFQPPKPTPEEGGVAPTGAGELRSPGPGSAPPGKTPKSEKSSENPRPQSGESGLNHKEKPKGARAGAKSSQTTEKNPLRRPLGTN